MEDTVRIIPYSIESRGLVRSQQLLEDQVAQIAVWIPSPPLHTPFICVVFSVCITFIIH